MNNYRYSLVKYLNYKEDYLNFLRVQKLSEIKYLFIKQDLDQHINKETQQIKNLHKPDKIQMLPIKNILMKNQLLIKPQEIFKSPEFKKKKLIKQSKII